MQIVNVIYGFVCLEVQNKKHLKCFLFTLIVKDDFKPAVVMYIFYYLCTFVMSIRNIYTDNIHNWIVYMLSYYHINSNPLNLKF